MSQFANVPMDVHLPAFNFDKAVDLTGSCENPAVSRREHLVHDPIWDHRPSTFFKLSKVGATSMSLGIFTSGVLSNAACTKAGCSPLAIS